MTVTCARADQGLYKFPLAEAHGSHGRALFSGNPASYFTPVEKYLPDNAALRTGRKCCIAYIIENKSNTNQIFGLEF
jgi:hypothetical protein